MPVSYERLCLVAAEKARRKEVQVQAQDSKNADELLEQEMMQCRNGPKTRDFNGFSGFRTEIQAAQVDPIT